jgi:hypothetical protein
MSRKDYRALAAALKWVKPSNPLSTPQQHQIVLESMSKQWLWTVDSIADALTSDNGRFDRERFNRACGRTEG